MEIVATFAQRLRDIMNIRNARARDVTASTGVSASQISHYLKGDYDPKQITIIKLSRYFRVNDLWLIGYDVDMQRFEPTFEGTKQEIIEMLDSLDQHDLERVKQFINDYFINR